MRFAHAALHDFLGARSQVERWRMVLRQSKGTRSENIPCQVFGRPVEELLFDRFSKRTLTFFFHLAAQFMVLYGGVALRLPEWRILPSQIETVAMYINHGRGISVLDLRGNSLGRKGIQDIASSLEVSQSLVRICLANT